MNEYCKNCIKNDVCKHIENFNSFVVSKTEDSEIATIKIECKFKKTENIVTYRELDLIPFDSDPFRNNRSITPMPYGDELPPKIYYTGDHIKY